MQHYKLVTTSMANVHNELHSLVLPVQTFTTRTSYAMSIYSNHPHFPRIPFVRRTFYPERFFPRTVTSWNRFPHGCVNVTILTFSSQISIIMYPSYPQNLHFLFPPLTFIPHTTFSDHQH